MDDVVILAPTRWKLRRAVTVVNQILGSLRLEKHSGKTFIGRVEKGFDSLGYHVSPKGLRVAAPTLARFLERATRLYEQRRKEPAGSDRLGEYVRRWRGWVRCRGLQIASALPLVRPRKIGHVVALNGAYEMTV